MSVDWESVMHRPARRVRRISVVAMLAALAVAGCGSGAPAPSALVASPAAPTPSASNAAPATPSPEPSTGGPAAIPDPCTLLPKAAIESIIGSPAEVASRRDLANGIGLVCGFDGTNGASLDVTVENDYPSVSDFNDAISFGLTDVTGLGEAARYIWSDVGTPPQATLWVYAKGLAVAMTLYKPGLTEAAGLELLKTLAASLPL